MLITETIEFNADLEIKYEEAENLLKVGCELSCSYDDDYEDLVITFDDRVVATISRHYKWKIDDLILRKSVSSINLVSVNKRAVTLNLHLTAEVNLDNVPKLANVPTAGIYMISVNDGKSVYVGQSGNVNQRLLNHWKNLFLGTHHNRPLQRAWDNSLNKFKAVLLEALENPYIGDYQQQKYLEAREKYWIAKYREEAQVLNRTDGEIIATPLAVKEFNEITKIKDDEYNNNVKKIRKEINSKIKLMNEENRKRSFRIYQLNDEVKELKKYIFWNTGIVSIFSSAKPSEIRNKKIRLEIAQHALSQLQMKNSEIRREIKLLEQERRLHRTTREKGIKHRTFS